MAFDKSKYLTNENGLEFKKINTDHYDQIIKGIKIQSDFDETDTSHFYTKTINVQNVKPNFLTLKKPLINIPKLNISNVEVEPLNKGVTINIADIKQNMTNIDIPMITNGIHNRAYFLTNPKEWTKIESPEIDAIKPRIEEYK